MAIVNLTPPYQQFYDDNGDPLSGGLVYSYTAGTLTPLATYTDQGGGTPNANPIVLDSAGRADIWLNNAGSYKFIVKTSGGVTVRTVDNITPFSTQSSSVAAITSGTIDGATIGATTPAAGTFTQINGGQIAGFRNYIINGGFNVWQRGTSFIGTAFNYSADRWLEFRNTFAAGMTVSRSTDVPTGFQYSMKILRDAANVDINNMFAVNTLETSNSIPLQGKTATLSYYAKAGANFTGSLGISVYTGTGTDQAANNIAGWTGSSLLSTVNASGISVSWQRFSASFAISSGATQIGLQVTRSGISGTAGADDSVYITGVQLEPGSTATPFENRGFSVEFDLCRRFYEKTFAYATAPAQSAGVTGAQSVLLPTGASGTFGTSMLMYPKRTAPTITTYNPSAANANWRDSTGAADRVVTVGTIGENSFVVSGAAGVAATTNIIHWSASAEL